MLVVAVGAPLLARWRLSSVIRRANELVGEIRTLITRDADAQRVVIETVAVEEAQPADVRDLRPVGLRLAAVRPACARSRVKAGDLRELPGALRRGDDVPRACSAIALLGVVVFGVLGLPLPDRLADPA